MATNAPELFSFSKLSNFSRCSQAYDYQYRQKIRRKESTNALFNGDMVHKALEQYYLGKCNHPKEALAKIWDEWFAKNKLPPDPHLGEYDLHGNLKKVSADLAELYWRASAACTDPAVWIRNKNGTVPQPGGLERNSQWNAELDRLGVRQRQLTLDHLASRLPGMEGVSLVSVYADSTSIAERYHDIRGLSAVAHVEFSFSKVVTDEQGETTILNPVYLPSGALFTGFIDLVAIVDGMLAIIDHKTSSGDAPDLVSLLYHDQLLLYAYAWHQLFGKWPGLIGINHLRSGECVFAPVKPERVADAVAHYENKLAAAQSGLAIKHRPFDYQSPCTGGAKSITEVKRMCPFFDLCYPELHALTQAPDFQEALA